MSGGWAARPAAGVLAVVAGGGVGHLAGAPFGLPVAGALAGAALAVALAAGLDTLRGLRLLAWLRGEQQEAAPRDAGFWGEIGYRAERAVRWREKETAAEQRRLSQFLAAIEASPNGVLLLDRGDHIEWCSATAADHFGLDPQRDRGQRVTNLIRAPAFVAHLQAGLAAQPVQFPAPGGRGLLSVLVRGYGEGMKLVLSQDVTERERTETMRRDFVANVSHEIRTPLTVLSGALETLAGLPLDEAGRARMLQMMGQQAQRMQALVDDLLALAQLEGGPRPATDRWTPLASLLSQLHEDAQVLSAGRHALQFDGGEDLEIAGDPKELLSAIGNLVGNAVRYTPDGGEIHVEARPLPGGGARVSVRDTGIGIAREQLPRLAERFYRVDGGRSRDSGGTGLGLSIVKHVAHRHGGELRIDSEPGQGSTFTLVLPAARVRRVAATVGTSP